MMYIKHAASCCHKPSTLDWFSFRLQATLDEWTKIVKILRLIDFEGLSLAVGVDPIPSSWASGTPSTSAPLLALPPPPATATVSAVASPGGWAELPKFDLLCSDDDGDEPRGSAAAASTTTTTTTPIATQQVDQLDDFGPALCFGSGSPETRGPSLATPTTSDFLEGIEELLTTTPLAAGHHGIVNSAKPPKKGKTSGLKGSGKDKGEDKGRGTTKGETGKGTTPSKTPKVSYNMHLDV